MHSFLSRLSRKRELRKVKTGERLRQKLAQDRSRLKAGTRYDDARKRHAYRYNSHDKSQLTTQVKSRITGHLSQLGESTMSFRVNFVAATGRDGLGAAATLPVVQAIVGKFGGSLIGGAGSSGDPIVAEFADKDAAAKAAQEAWYDDSVESAALAVPGDAINTAALSETAKAPSVQENMHSPDDDHDIMGTSHTTLHLHPGSDHADVHDAIQHAAKKAEGGHTMLADTIPKKAIGNDADSDEWGVYGAKSKVVIPHVPGEEREFIEHLRKHPGAKHISHIETNTTYENSGAADAPERTPVVAAVKAAKQTSEGAVKENLDPKDMEFNPEGESRMQIHIRPGGDHEKVADHVIGHLKGVLGDDLGKADAVYGGGETENIPHSDWLNPGKADKHHTVDVGHPSLENHHFDGIVKHIQSDPEVAKHVSAIRITRDILGDERPMPEVKTAPVAAAVKAQQSTSEAIKLAISGDVKAAVDALLA
jgi:hypothetical protein